MFHCKKCGGLKPNKQSRCSAPCFKNNTLSTFINKLVSDEVTVAHEKKENVEQIHSDRQIHEIINKGVEHGNFVKQYIKPELKQEQETTEFDIQINACPINEHDVLQRSYDDPIFKLYPGKYMDPFEYLIIHFWISQTPDSFF
tara:strand:- start:395 stop:823 length:429 start_codon:yes stop_codon:yes gene_type:complete